MMTLKIKVLCVDDDRENKVLCNNDDDDYVSKNALQISRLYHFSKFLYLDSNDIAKSFPDIVAESKKCSPFSS